MKFQDPTMHHSEEMDGKARSNVPPPLFQSWGHKNNMEIKAIYVLPKTMDGIPEFFFEKVYFEQKISRTQKSM